MLCMHHMNTQKTIGIWGFGKEGQALYNYFKTTNQYSELIVLLDNDHPVPDGINVLREDEARQAIETGYFDIIYKSPGISLYDPSIKLAKDNGTIISSATNLWFETNPDTKTIIITGTKGKSTTSSLLYHVMSSLNISVALAGNIGVPLLDLKTPSEYTILELSSYQLADLSHAPDIFTILNLFPEHLEWHQTHENYYKDKLSCARMNGTKTIIANPNNDTLRDQLHDTDHDIVWFSRHDHAPIKTQLKGDHNQDNIAAVLKICETLGLDQDSVIAAIENFQPLRHRLQEFKSAQGQICVNDSISTTPESTIEALKVYSDHKTILIAGGTDRGQNYQNLAQFIQSSTVQTILCLPENGPRLAQEITGQAGPCQALKMDNLDMACEWVKAHATQNHVIILSPAAPSYGQFKNFEERGNRFIQIMG